MLPLPSIFVGRERELQRLASGLSLVAAAVIDGAAGVGKSALAHAAAAHWSGPTELVSAAQVALDGDAVWRRLDVRGALLVVDDLEAWAPDRRAALVRGALATLRRGRLVAVCRERMPLDTDDPDRVQIHLEGLERPAAADLWDTLVALYGPACDFETAWQRSRGNPLLMRDIARRPLGDAAPLAIDATCHELRVSGVVLRSLATRTSLRRLLYAFAGTADGTLDRDAIAGALWSVAYDPLRHESSLKSSIRRLRALLAGTGASIEVVSEGYQLHLPPRSTFYRTGCAASQRSTRAASLRALGVA